MNCATPLKHSDAASPAPETPDPAKAEAATLAPPIVLPSATDSAAQPNAAAPLKGPLRKGGMWLPIAAALLIGCAIGGIVVYKSQAAPPGITAPGSASSEAKAVAKGTVKSSATSQSDTAKPVAVRSEAQKTATPRREASKPATATDDIQACKQITNIFKKEACMFKACRNRWGTPECPHANQETNY